MTAHHNPIPEMAVHVQFELQPKEMHLKDTILSNHNLNLRLGPHIRTYAA